ncbi:MAG: ecdysteroid 22-kinase family protein [Chloroflexales bacterium]|nr:ecdysteroid 22-kinase family protein [Chloroflexales bacterium]
MANPNLPVPSSETDITPTWLRAALASAFPAATFVPLEAQRIGEAYGFASRIVRYRWQDHGTSQSVVVKLWDTDGNAGIGEALFYQTFRDVGARVPRCFHSGVDAATQKAVLVLEDVPDALQGDVLEQLDLERAQAVARNLARLHATWLDHPTLAELPWLPDVSMWERDAAWFDSRRTLFLQRFGDHLHGVSRMLLDRLEHAPRVANARLSSAPTTLLHGDFHLDNIIFEQQTEPVLLDWSRPLKGPAALNVAHILFVMGALQHFDAILASYLDEFNRVAAQPLHKEVFEQQLGGALLREFAASTCGIARWQPTLPRAVAMLDAGIKHL